MTLIYSDFYALGQQQGPEQLPLVREALSLARKQPQRALEILKRVKAKNPSAWGAWVDAVSCAYLKNASP